MNTHKSKRNRSLHRPPTCARTQCHKLDACAICDGRGEVSLIIHKSYQIVGPFPFGILCGGLARLAGAKIHEAAKEPRATGYRRVAHGNWAKSHLNNSVNYVIDLEAVPHRTQD